IRSITAGAVENFNLTARSLGSLTSPGGGPARLAGDVRATTVHLTGNDRTPGRYGLKTLTVRGTVVDSTFDIDRGNVASVTVGRFLNSNLFLNYTLAADVPLGAGLAAAGAFDGTAAFRL